MATLQVQTDFKQLNETRFVVTIANADNVNHIVIFMTGQIPFPDGMGGAGGNIGHLDRIGGILLLLATRKTSLCVFV